MTVTWTVVESDTHPGTVHVVPDDDLVRHTETDCPCGPRTEPVPRDDGSIGWLVAHHSLDGREQHEPQ